MDVAGSGRGPLIMSTQPTRDLRKTDIDFVVTGTPRSGTTYVSHILKNFGFDCLHERRFTPWEVVTDAYRLTSRPWGDASWLAAPFLPILPDSTKVFHVVREPLRTLNSIIGTGQIDWPDDYRTFIARYCWGDENYWPTNVELDAQTFWVRWNEMIEHSGRVVMRFRVEDMATALRRITSELGMTEVTEADVANALAGIRTDVNTRRHRPPGNVTRADLTAEFRETARRYGYDY